MGHPPSPEFQRALGVLRPRIIPCLLVSGAGLVKTVNFASPKYVGDPINAVRIFNEKEADELMVLDIDATAEDRSPDFAMIEHLAVECRMPLCYGGGVKTPDQAKKITGLGVEKVAISTAAVKGPELVSRIAREIGSQSVSVVYDVRPGRRSGDYDVWTDNGRVNTRRSVFDLALQAVDFGAGEIVVNSIERDGQMKGYDVELARRLREKISVPVTMLGGAGSHHDLEELISACGIVGAAAGSMFVFKGAYRAVLINYPSPAQKDEIINRGLGL